ncbi:TonB-dependent receptor [Pelomonas sp. V22]|uniref:TonB-dependent receptor plug domain-containing protein n=1 Tax=Pelomonas sp. V22 TaxID=2822139 RepID=UPI0024A98B37|nr:TonB-dependent receptor [Pelomonas sp. V22]MDI4632644.1 TonB-dependent receptor [Pelomonas sp. V22]
MKFNRLTSLLITAGLAGWAQAQTVKPPEADKLERVEVTGSRIKQVSVEGVNPVTVITAEDMAKNGTPTVFDALQTLMQATGTGLNENAGSFAPLAKQINLRGLGAGRTLLLINGRRTADYPWANGSAGNFASFGNIPSAAVARIEIVSAGASAVYGSDAVAGVINVILKENYSGDSVKVRLSGATSGGRKSRNVEWMGGRASENSNFIYVLQGSKVDPLFGYDRDFMDSNQDNPAPIDPRLGYQAPVSLRIVRSGNPLSNTTLDIPAGTCEKFGFTPYTSKSITKVGTTETVNTLGPVCGWDGNDPLFMRVAGREDMGGYLMGNWNLNKDTSAWASLMGYHSKALGGGSLLSISGPQVDGKAVTSTWFDAGEKRRLNAFRRLTPDELGGVNAARQFFTETNFDIATGLKGVTRGGYDWQLSINRAEQTSNMKRSVMDGSSLSDFFFGPLLAANDPACAGAGTTPCYKLNKERWYRPMTTQEYSSISENVEYVNKSWVTQAQGSITGELTRLFNQPLGFALVGEYASQGYDTTPPVGLTPDVRTLYGLLTTGGGGSRKRASVGGELSVPVWRTVTGTVSGRVDKYDDISSIDLAKTWGAGLQWRPTSSVLARVNYGTTFKAPDMHFIYQKATGGSSAINDTYRCTAAGLLFGSQCGNSLYQYTTTTVTRGDPTLREETGTTFGAGLVWDVSSQLSLTVDYYDLRMRNRIRSLGFNEIIDAENGCKTGLDYNLEKVDYAPDSLYCQSMAGRVVREATTDGSIGNIMLITGGYLNDAFYRTKGVDLSANYRFKTANYGQYSATLKVSNTIRSYFQQNKDAAINKNWRNDRSNFDYPNKMSLALGWSMADYSSNVFVTRYGKLPVATQPTGATEVYRLKPYVLVNWNGSMRYSKQLDLSISVNNLLNNFGPKDVTNTSFPYRHGQYSVVGREVGIQAAYKF